ncbi:hypothetical protein AGMMS50267_12070 [Spirochaetia bacterium]|nr:hypothetical protein AGMMS50267_12070 [Spirochaetia bacterium]
MRKILFNKTTALAAALLLLSCGLFLACPQEAKSEKTALASKIIEAETNRDSVEVSIIGDGTDVEIGMQWVTVQAKDEYNATIAAAKKVLYNNSAEQTEIDRAVADINTATAVFDPLKGDGLNPNYNLRFLRVAIYTGQLLLTDNPASATNSGIEYDPSAFWSLKADRDDLQAVIDAALFVLGDVNAKQADIDSITITISVANQKFSANCPKEGIRPDKTLLKEAIDAAEENIVSVFTSVNGSELVEVQKWVTSADKIAYRSAITAANGVYTVNDDPSVVQTVVDQALAALTTETNTYNSAKANGSIAVASLPNPQLVSAPVINGTTTTTKQEIILTFDQQISILTAAGFTVGGSVSATGVADFKLDSTEKVLTITLNGKPSFDEVSGITLDYDETTGNVQHKYNAGKKTQNFTQPVTVNGFTSVDDSRPSPTSITLDGTRELYSKEGASSSTSTAAGGVHYRVAPAPRGPYTRMVYLNYSPSVHISTESYYAFTTNLPGVRVNRITKATNGTNTDAGNSTVAARTKNGSPAIVLYLNKTLSLAEVNSLTISYDMTKGTLVDTNANKAASFTNVPVVVSNYYASDADAANDPWQQADILDVVWNNTLTAYNAAVDYTVADFDPKSAVLKSEAPMVTFTRFTAFAGTGLSNVHLYAWHWNAPGSNYISFPYRDSPDIVNKLNDSFSIESIFSNSGGYAGMGNSSVYLYKRGANFEFVITIDGTEYTLSSGFNVAKSPPFNVPMPGAWDASDVVGVWDKPNKKLSIYIDGVLGDTITVPGPGNFTQPSTDGQWISVNGYANDALTGVTSPNTGDGEIILARVFGKALTGLEVESLWTDHKIGTISKTY